MKITVSQHLRETAHEHTVLEIAVDGIEQSFALDLDFSAILDRSWQHRVRALDFLLIASAVYALDKIVSRESATDRWKRRFSVTLPLHEPQPWGAASKTLCEALGFLTGDEWEFSFVQAEAQFSKRRPNRRKTPKGYPQSPVVSLLSGGLDSLIGALDLLTTYPDRRLLFVSHYDGHVSGPAKDQDNLREFLEGKFRGRVSHLQVRTGVRLLNEPTVEGEVEIKDDEEKPKKYKFETSFRSRSLVFLGLAMYGASKIGGDVPVLIPENGPIALNLPLNPSRRGACSTRTVHPHFISALQRALGEAGLTNPIRNPYEFKTKGEMVDECKAPDLLRLAYPKSNSCGKAGRKTYWENRRARACGSCVPCLFRRASLHRQGLDTELYGNDVLTGVPDAYPDFHALLGVISKDLSIQEISKSLIANGRLPLNRLTDYASVVRRMLDEVTMWLRDKASKKARSLAKVRREVS